VNPNNINYLIPENVCSGIYKITAPDGYYYIGSTKNLKKRIKEHFYDLKTDRHHTVLMQRIFNAHPEYIWTVELLQEVVLTDDWLIPIEQEHLDSHYGTSKCINHNPIAIKPPSCIGRKCSLKTRAKLSTSHKGKKLTIEHRAKISTALKGKIKPWLSAARKGKPLSPETRAKISASLIKRNRGSVLL